MKLLPVTSKELIPGAAFCWQSTYDINRTVVRVDGGKLVYRIENAEGVFSQRLDKLGIVYLVCPTAGARNSLRKAMRLRRLAKDYRFYFNKYVTGAESRNVWPPLVEINKRQAEIFEVMVFHYEDCIQALIAGICPVTIHPLPHTTLIDRIGRLLVKLWG